MHPCLKRVAVDSRDHIDGISHVGIARSPPDHLGILDDVLVMMAAFDAGVSSISETTKPVFHRDLDAEPAEHQIASRQQRAGICDETPLNTTLNWTRTKDAITVPSAGAHPARDFGIALERAPP